MKILAIDQGTTSTRALIFGANGQGRLVHSVVHRQFYPAPGQVEHDAGELLANLRACIAAAEPVDAIGLANQGESCLGWDAETGDPVSPVIVWQDDRTQAWIDGAGAEAAALVRERAGLPLDPYFSGSKLGLILRDNSKAQALHAQGRLRLGTTDAYFRDRLTGRFETDPATASRTALMNLTTCAWDADLCALFGVPPETLPTISDNTGDLGQIDGTPLTASIVDQQAALYGHGCRNPGDAKITFGTGAFALSVTGALTDPGDSGPLPTVGWRKAGETATYALDGGVYAASSALNWARDLGLFADFRDINAFEQPPAIRRGLAFVPALAGLACPHWDRAARGAWMGLGLDTSGRDMVQAVLEGVAFRMAEVCAAMDALQPLGAAVSIDGGMSANPYFGRFLADQLGRDVVVSDDAELTARGVAMLAAEGFGQPLQERSGGQTIRPRPTDPADKQRFAAAREAVQTYGQVNRRER